MDLGNLGILLILLYIFALVAPLFWKKRNDFLKSEVKRYVTKNCEVPENWSSRGRLYRRGLTVIIDKNGKKKFVKQTKLIDIGIL